MDWIKQKIEIAKFCGWSQIHNAHTMAIAGSWRGYPPKGQIIGRPELLPDYSSDLNAMHEAEKALNRHQRSVFRHHIGGMFPCDEDGDTMSWEGRFGHAIHATAAQRAEAFLKTIGKWEED